MSTPENSLPPGLYTERLEMLFGRIARETRNAEVMAERGTELEVQLRALIMQNGVTEETKFIIAGLPYAKHDDLRGEYVENLRHLDAQLQNSAGETVVWLTTETEEISKPFNPAITPLTRKSYFLNVGILPQDARLAVSLIGRVTAPVDKSVVIELSGLYMSDSQLSLYDNQLLPANPAFARPTKIEEGSSIELAAYSPNFPYPIAIGNYEVENIFDRHGLESDELVASALVLLTEAIV